MLRESRLFSFLDQNNNFCVYFFEGQKIIHDIILMNKMGQHGLSFLRDFILTFQPMISFLKPGEGYGIYIDSQKPFFRLKIESNASGQMRTLILPEKFTNYPDTITGICRVSKLFPNKEQKSYTSIIKLNEVRLCDIANQILKESYQVQSEVYISAKSDQSLMYMKMPKFNVDNIDEEDLSLFDYKKIVSEKLNFLFNKGLSEEKEIIHEFKKLNFQYLASKPVFFKCACSRDRMILNLKSLINSNHDELFDPGKESLEVDCDYCKTSYLITKNELLDR